VAASGAEPDVEPIVVLPPFVVVVIGLEEARGGASRIPGVGALLLEGAADARVDARVVEDLDRTVARLAHEHGDRHAPGALARDHPVGSALDHAGDAVLALWRPPARDLGAFERAVAQRIARLGMAGRVRDPLCPGAATLCAVERG